MVMGVATGRGLVKKDLNSAGRVGLKGATYLGSHFFLKALMNLRTMARILTVLGNEYVLGKTMYSDRLARAWSLATLPELSLDVCEV